MRKDVLQTHRGTSTQFCGIEHHGQIYLLPRAMRLPMARPAIGKKRCVMTRPPDGVAVTFEYESWVASSQLATN